VCKDNIKMCLKEWAGMPWGFLALCAKIILKYV